MNEVFLVFSKWPFPILRLRRLDSPNTSSFDAV